MCLEIQESLLGRGFDFKREEESEAWYEAGGLEKCPMVCAVAARIAADIILALKGYRQESEEGGSNTVEA